MKTEFTHESQIEIMVFLYQFRDDNKFYKLNEDSLNIPSKTEKYFSIHALRDKALIGTDRELHYSHTSFNPLDHNDHHNDIKARILPKGIAAVELFLKDRSSI